MVVAIQQYNSSSENRSNNGEHCCNGYIATDVYTNIPHTQIYKTANNNTANGTSCGIDEPSESRNEHSEDRYKVDDVKTNEEICHQILDRKSSQTEYDTFTDKSMCYDTNTKEIDDIDIVIFKDNGEQDVGFMVVPTGTKVTDIEGNHRTVLAASFPYQTTHEADKCAHERFDTVQRIINVSAQSQYQNARMATKKSNSNMCDLREKREHGRNITNTFFNDMPKEDRKDSYFADDVEQTRETDEINANNNENPVSSEHMVVTLKSKEVKQVRQNATPKTAELCTPKRMNDQTPQTAKTQRSIHRAHKIEPTTARYSTNKNVFSQSKSFETIGNKNRDTATNRTPRRENSYRKDTRLSGSIKHPLDPPKRTESYVQDRQPNSYTREITRENTRERSISGNQGDVSKVKRVVVSVKTGAVETKSDHSPTRPMSNIGVAKKKARYQAKPIIILKKGQDISEILAELENRINMNAEIEEEYKSQHQMYTILKPSQTLIPEMERKQMRNSVKISKSQNSIQPVDCRYNNGNRTREHYHRVSAVDGRYVNALDRHAKQSPYGRRRKHRKNTIVPKTQMEVYQRMIEGGQLRSKFSRYKTEGLKELKLTEELHKGTFAVKYKVRSNTLPRVAIFIALKLCLISNYTLYKTCKNRHVFNSHLQTST